MLCGCPARLFQTVLERLKGPRCVSLVGLEAEVRVASSVRPSRWLRRFAFVSHACGRRSRRVRAGRADPRWVWRRLPSDSRASGRRRCGLRSGRGIAYFDEPAWRADRDCAFRWYRPPARPRAHGHRDRWHAHQGAGQRWRPGGRGDDEPGSYRLAQHVGAGRQRGLLGHRVRHRTLRGTGHEDRLVSHVHAEGGRS